MNRIAITVLLMHLALPALARDPCIESRAPECKPVQEARCTQAINEMLKTMRATPLQTQRDRDDVGALIAKVEKMLADNRRQGVEECRSWGEFGGILAKQ